MNKTQRIKVSIMRYSIHFALSLGITLVFSAVLDAQSPNSSDPVIRPGLVEKITDKIHVIPDNFVRLVPNIGIIIGDEAVLVVDTGLGIENGMKVYDLVSELSGNKKIFVTISHYHPEHSLGVGGFPEDAIFIASRVQSLEMENGKRLKDQFSRQSAINNQLINNMPYPTPDILYDDGYAVDLGDLTVQLISVGPLHTRGDSIIFIEEESVLFSGDVMMGGIIPSIDSEYASFDKWKGAIEKIDKLSPKFIIGSHGDIGDQTLVHKWNLLISTISSALTEYRSASYSESKAAQQLTLLLNEEFPGWRNDRRRMNAAAASEYREGASTGEQ